MATEVKSPVIAGQWASVVRKDPSIQTQELQPASEALPRKAELATSKEGIKTVVLDAGAIINGTLLTGQGLADEFYTVREVLEEIRDARARQQLAALPITIKCLDPSPESLTTVVQFARSTGDLQTLSDTDLKVIALTYTLEAEAHGTTHIRSQPPALVISQVQHREKDPPGWGSNVPNILEWEEIPEDEDGIVHAESHILGLKNLHLGIEDGTGMEEKRYNEPISESNVDNLSWSEATELDQCKGLSTSSNLSLENDDASNREFHIQEHQKPRNLRKPRNVHIKQVSLEGKVMVAEGLDASKGEHDEDSEHEWEKAVSRSTRRKHIKRAARISLRDNVQQKHEVGGVVESEKLGTGETDTISVETEQADARHGKLQEHIDSLSDDPCCNSTHDNNSESDQSAMLKLIEESSIGSMNNAEETCMSNVGAVESEISWDVRPFWKSSVACMTTDFAMQNVILQMGLRLLSSSGMQVRELHRWIVKCHACGKVSSEVGRLFCPKCGNGGTLFKISVTVNANGRVQSGKPRRLSIRGTRYSLPAPKGGRNAAIVNPILREDQLSHRLLQNKQRKAGSILGLDFRNSADDAFKVSDKKFEKTLPLRRAAAILSGRRNPNDNKFSKKHK